MFKKKNDVTVLSRGYGRISKGFRLGDATSSAKSIGDEPKMFLGRHSEIRVAVSNSRREGMKKRLASLKQKSHRFTFGMIAFSTVG